MQQSYPVVLVLTAILSVILSGIKFETQLMYLHELGYKKGTI